MIEIATTCDTCDRSSADEPARLPLPGAIAGFRDCIDWPDARESPPALGTRQPLLVGFPFRASEATPFWVLFQPRSEHAEPEALALVRCGLRADLGAYDGPWPEDHAYRPERRLEVEVLEVRPLVTLPATLPVTTASPFDASWDRLFEGGGGAARSAHAWELGPFTYFEADVEGDLGAIAITVATPRGRALVVYSAWSMCADGELVALNHPLDDAAYRRLCARFT